MFGPYRIGCKWSVWLQIMISYSFIGSRQNKNGLTDWLTGYMHNWMPLCSTNDHDGHWPFPLFEYTQANRNPVSLVKKDLPLSGLCQITMVAMRTDRTVFSPLDLLKLNTIDQGRGITKRLLVWSYSDEPKWPANKREWANSILVHPNQ